MGNRLFRIILGIIIGIAALIGTYFALPGSVKYPMEEFFQKTFQEGKYAVAEYYQKQKVPKHDMTFGDMIANCGKGSSAWVVETLDEADDKSTGHYFVHAYAYKVDISMEHENGQENMISYSQAAIEISFKVEKKKDGSFVTTTYSVYIDDQNQTDFYRTQALNSMVAKANGAVNDAKMREKKESTATTEEKK